MWAVAMNFDEWLASDTGKKLARTTSKKLNYIALKKGFAESDIDDVTNLILYIMREMFVSVYRVGFNEASAIANNVVANHKIVGCSSCGGEFSVIDRDSGFSHCKDHSGLENIE